MPAFQKCLIVLSLIFAALIVTAERPAVAKVDDFTQQVSAASAALEPVLQECEKLTTDGDTAAADAKLLATFTDSSRSAAQSLVLGNVLFENNRKLSYDLHRTANKAEPHNPIVLWEWAMEQHRAGDYAAALASYEEYSKLKPRSAYSYALQSDCLLRLGRTDDAVAAWKKSEAAPDGNLEQMESLVCAVHRAPAAFQHRAELLHQVTAKQDMDAAVDLIALDCNFPNDWWNAGPQKTYLAHDLAAVDAAVKWPADDLRVRAMHAAADCAIASIESLEAPDEGAAKVKAILEKQQIFIDAHHTVPMQRGLLLSLAGSIVSTHGIDDSTIRQTISPAVIEAAKMGSDPTIWNAAVLLLPSDKSDALLQLEHDGWKATHDPRFAIGYLTLKDHATPLKSMDPELVSAVKEFPESADMQHIAVVVANRDHVLTKAMLAAAAMAEFTHFSSFEAPATVVNRPRADYLRVYFKRMAAMPASAPSTVPAAREK